MLLLFFVNVLKRSLLNFRSWRTFELESFRPSNNWSAIKLTGRGGAQPSEKIQVRPAACHTDWGPRRRLNVISF
jgi:hypothetical protein